MTRGTPRPTYGLKRLPFDFRPASRPDAWQGVEEIVIKDYLWENNGYRPVVRVKAAWTPGYLAVRFDVAERIVRATYENFQDPVYKDSCVEMFIDVFPETGVGYINFEANALGTMLSAIGAERGKRRRLTAGEIAAVEKATFLKTPVDGDIGADAWWLEYRVPLALFEALYGEKVRPGIWASGNFYKCGDDTHFPHYGAWSPVDWPTPDFHRPEFFGRLEFLPAER